ncbi:hypothetical protein CC86DRAFT_114813 [Ophiobolus disseminans]|uniref:Uncharacterized protein n=1 Tax=Ophiobolus disseminans TaxID=1469910 RepID=A0A6A6ZJX9_9PLEO|nr:hypothetical protein CC86DRAFT_114813 [Ophiobolus disseminans]
MACACRLVIDNFVSKLPHLRPSQLEQTRGLVPAQERVCYCCASSNRDSLRQRTESHLSKEPLQDYCTTCIHYPTSSAIPFARASETFQAGSRLQPHLSRRSNRRVKHHIYTLSHREMVVFCSQYSGRMQPSLVPLPVGLGNNTRCLTHTCVSRARWRR